MGRGCSERVVDRGPAFGKRALTESIGGSADTALAAVAFFDRAVGELRSQLAALAGAIGSGDQLLAVAAAAAIGRCLTSARGHIVNVPADQAPERRILLVKLEAQAVRALDGVREAGILESTQVRRSAGAAPGTPGPALHGNTPAGLDQRTSPLGAPAAPVHMGERASTASAAHSTLAIAADLTGLALDAYMFNDALDEYGMGKALTNTSLDRARSLSQSEPSLAWLAVQLVGLKWSAAATVRTFREATALRRAVRAGEQVNEAAVHALDAAGEQAGLGKIGQRVMNEASTTTDDAVGAAGAGANAGRKLARHPLYGDVVGDLASSNPEALGRRLGAKVQLDEDLGTGVEVVFHVDEASETVSILAIQAGRLATAADVLAHARTIKLLQRYNGAWGRFRRRLDDVLAFFSGRAARPGSEAWKARIEVEKIRRIAASRRRALARAPTGEIEHILSAEIAFLDEQAATFDAIAAEARGKAAVGGAHAVGMPDTSRLRELAARMQSDTAASFKQGARGIQPPPRGAQPPPIPASLQRVADRVTKLPAIKPIEEATRWIPKARAGDPADLRTEMARVAREHADAAEAELRVSANFGALAAKDLKAAERIAVHVHHQTAQQYFLCVEEGATTLASRAAKRAARDIREGADEYAAADTILDAVGVKPVRGNLPANHEFAGSVIPRSYFSDYPQAQKLLDEKGMPGLPMSPSGQPDFTRWIYQQGGIKGDVEIPKLTGSYHGDFIAADAKAGFTATNPRPWDWTWHHHEGTRMILVPTDLHKALTHLGPAAHYRGITGVKDAYR